MTWGACTDPFWQVRSYLMRWHWTTARRGGQWVLLDGSRVLARERELYRLVKRIRSLNTTWLQLERIEAEAHQVSLPEPIREPEVPVKRRAKAA